MLYLIYLPLNFLIKIYYLTKNIKLKIIIKLMLVFSFFIWFQDYNKQLLKQNIEDVC